MPMFIVSISGNSGTGKSSLLKYLARELVTHVGDSLHTFDESLFHHPYLERMFQDPAHWAFPIQVNFLLQRALALRRASEMDTRSLVLMERSLEEDELFFGYYESRGYISKSARAAYVEMRRHLLGQLPGVACHIFLTGSAEQLAARVENDVRAGRRPGELTGAPLLRYLMEIGEIYARWALTKREQAREGTLWLEAEQIVDHQQICQIILETFRNHVDG